MGVCSFADFLARQVASRAHSGAWCDVGLPCACVWTLVVGWRGLQGSRSVELSDSKTPEVVGVELAEELLTRGAAALLGPIKDGRRPITYGAAEEKAD